MSEVNNDRYYEEPDDFDAEEAEQEWLDADERANEERRDEELLNED